MEPKFQTSFIPKKPISMPGGAIITRPKRGASSLFMTLSVLIFIASLLAVGGAFAWKQYLISSQEGEKQQLADREKQFNTDLIEQLKAVNVKIDAAKSILSSHVAVSSIFDIIGRLTIAHVRFQSLDLVMPASASDSVKISLNGYGTSLAAVAFQSDVLASLEQYGLRDIVKNPILSEPSLDTAGSVSFGLTATVDPSSLNYVKVLKGTSPANQSQATSTSQ